MNIRRIGRRCTLAAAGFALVACQDAPTQPTNVVMPASMTSEAEAQAVVAPLNVAAQRLEALRDALNRVHIALAPDDRSKAVSNGLRQAIGALERSDARSASRAIQSVEQTLQRYSSRDDAMAPDLDAIRLALREASVR